MEWLQKAVLLNFIKLLQIINRLTKKLTPIILAALLSNIIFASTVYICKDADGNDLYTDSPDSNPDCVNPTKKEVDPIPNYTPPFISNVPTKSDTPNPIDEQKYSSIDIITPQSGETVNRCGGQLDIIYNITPGLYSGDTAYLYIDGSKYQSISQGAGGTFTVSSLGRGQHTIKIKIKRDGSTVQSSNNVSFTFLRNCAGR